MTKKVSKFWKRFGSAAEHSGFRMDTPGAPPASDWLGEAAPPADADGRCR